MVRQIPKCLDTQPTHPNLRSLSDHSRHSPRGSEKKKTIQIWIMVPPLWWSIAGPQKPWAKPSRGSPMYSISRKLGEIKSNSFTWCREYKRNKGLDWEDITLNIERMQKDFYDTKNRGKSTSIEEEIRKWKDQEEQIKLKLEFWRQRARLNWNTWGDYPSKIFYRVSKQRSKQNEIFQIKDSNEEWVSDKIGIQNQFQDYFSNLF